MSLNQPIAPHTARWDPQARHDMAIVRIERAVEKARQDGRVEFTLDDLEYVAMLMGLPRHNDDTLSPVRGGELSSQPTIRTSARRAAKPIDPDKRYRLPSGEVITGSEVLRRRGQA